MDPSRQPVTLSVLITLLADTTGPESAIVRDNIMRVCRILSSHFTFLIPDELCSFLSRFDYISTDERLVVKDDSVGRN